MSDDVYQEVAPSDMTGLDDIYARKSGLKRSPSPRLLQGMMRTQSSLSESQQGLTIPNKSELILVGLSHFQLVSNCPESV